MSFVIDRMTKHHPNKHITSKNKNVCIKSCGVNKSIVYIGP